MSPTSYNDRFHFLRPDDLIIGDSGDDIDVFNLDKGIAADGPLLEFRDLFHQLLEYRYGHLSENQLFGNLNQSQDDIESKEDGDDTAMRVILLDDFEIIGKCSSEQTFLDFFSAHFESSPKELVGQFLRSLSELFKEKKDIFDTDDFHRVVIDCVTAFCLYLIDSRVRVMEVFEQIETDVHQATISYSFLQKQLEENQQQKIEDFIERIQDLNKQYKKCNGESSENTPEKNQLYQSQISLYQTIVSFIDPELISLDTRIQVDECLNSNKSHYSYLQEYLNHLCALLSPMLQRYTISYEHEDDYRIFNVKFVAGSFAGANAFLKEWLEKNSMGLKPGDHLRFFADSVVYADANITLPGISFACISSKTSCTDKDGVSINTDGLSILDNDFSDTALSGEAGNQYSNHDGKPGIDGNNGRYGNPGGHILLVSGSLCCDDWNLSANGSRGENGQNGGNGGAGWSPSSEGRDGYNPKFKSGWGYSSCKSRVIINYGTFGENGGQGGDAGMGGAAGKSGISGKIQLIDLENNENCQENREKIEDGMSGIPGLSGKGGKHTRHGKDNGAYAKHAGFWGTCGNFFSGKDCRQTTTIVGELTHSAIPKLRGSGACYEEDGTSLPYAEKAGSHPDFSSSGRGKNKDGRKSQVKVNHAVANENKAIDKCACFHSMQEQCRQSLQHWNAKSHASFMSAFAKKIGEPLEENFTVIKHSEMTRNNSEAWITRIHSQSASLQRSMQQQTTTERRRERAQLMKDVEERSHYKTLGYLGAKTDSPKAILDLSSLKTCAGKYLSLLSVEVLLSGDSSDIVVNEIMLKISEREIFISNGPPSLMRTHKATDYFRILKQGSDRYQYYHVGSYSGRSIHNKSLLALLNDVEVENNQIQAIPRDNMLYSQMATWIRTNYGPKSVPCCKEQLCCIWKLKLLIGIRKTYLVVGGKYYQTQQFQYVQKFYAQCVNDVITATSCDELSTIQKILLGENLLILPLDASWISTRPFCNAASLKMKQAIDNFNKIPSSKKFFKLLSSIHLYHLKRFTESHDSYIEHLSSETVVDGLRAFYVQVCDILRMLCDDKQIREGSEKVPCVAASQSLIEKIHPLPINCQHNQKAFTDLLAKLKTMPSPVYTIISTMFVNLAQYFQSTTGIQVPDLQSQISVPGVRFEDAYAAFQAFPSAPTLTAAMSVCATSSKRIVSKFPDEILNLLSWLFNALQRYFHSFEADTNINDFFQRVNEDGLNITALEKIVSLIDKTSQGNYSLNTTVKSFLQILRSIIDQTCPDDIEKCDHSLLQMDVSMSVLNLELFCVQLKKERSTCTTDSIRTRADNFRNVFRVLGHYPLSQPSPLLKYWVLCIQKRLQTISDEKGRAIATSEVLVELSCTLKQGVSQLQLMQKLLDIKELVCTSTNLEYFSLLYNLERTEMCKQFLLHKLSLSDRFEPSSCLSTLVKWIYPDLSIQTERKVHVVLERLPPQHKVVFQTQEPNEEDNIDCHTLVLYPSSGQWESCTLSINQPHSLQYREVSDDTIANALRRNMTELLEKEGEQIILNQEEAACLLGRLGYENEFHTHFKVDFCGQVLVDEHSANVCIECIDLRTCLCEQICIEDVKNKLMDEHLKDKVVIIQCLCRDKALEIVKTLEVLELTEDDISQIQSSVAACVIKHPSKPAIVYNIEKCESIVDTEFTYSLPLVTNTNENPIKNLLLVSNLLNKYDQLYQASLPTSQLNTALKAAIQDSPTVLYDKDVPKLVRLIRQQFVKECVNSLPCDLQCFQMMKQLLEEILLPACESIVVEDVYLLGMESYLQFLLIEGRKRKHKGHVNIDDTYLQLWENVLKVDNFSVHTAKCLCSAFAYLRESENVNNYLTFESAHPRFQMYSNISEGLKIIIEKSPNLNKPLSSETEQLLNRIPNFTKYHRIEVFLEVIKDMEEDEQNLYTLMSMIRSIEDLHEEFLKIECVVNCSLSNESCLENILYSPEFYSHVSIILLSWVSKRLHEIIEFFQVILSDKFFRHDSRRELVLHAFCSCLVSKSETAFQQYAWETIHDLLLIGAVLTKLLQAELLENLPLTNQSDCTDLLSNLLTIIQVIKVTPDLLPVVSILRQVPSGQWLSNLLAFNFVRVCTDHFKSNCIYLHDKLMCIDTKLLQILYNVFTNDQYHKADPNSTVGILTLAQLITIIEWLPFVEVCSEVSTSLCNTSMPLWEKELAVIHFKQYIDHWADITKADKQKTMYLMNRVRLEAGIPHLELMSLLYTMRSKYISSGAKDNGFLMTLFEDLYYKRVTLQEISSIIVDCDYLDWLPALREIESNKRSSKPHRVSEIIDLIEYQMKSGDFAISPRELEQFKGEAVETIDCIEHCSKQPLPSKQQLRDFFKTLQKCISVDEKDEWLKKHRVQFVVHIVLAWMLATSTTSIQVPYNTQIVSLLLFLQTSNKGLLQQVKTGEGKTLIVGMLAAAKALLGCKVDVVSSNRDLAKDGRDKCEKFFDILGLVAAVNCGEDDDTNQQAYNSHIVYGEVGSFQRDVLTEENNPGGTNFSARYLNSERNCLLVDEVDSMFLDKGRHMLYLSHESPALKHLESLFVTIWCSILNLNPQSENRDTSFETILNELADHLIALIENETISVPEYLKGFCRHKMKAWVRSAYQARLMDANDQFILDHKREEQSDSRHIFPIDKQTGTEQYNMKWSNGLSQFLELKYRLPLSTESLKAVFISNKRFFKKYNEQLYGLTGTLGSVSSRRLLETVYTIRTVELPTNRVKRYSQAKSHCASNEEEWFKQIQTEISSKTASQPILVICENIRQLQLLKNYLLTHAVVAEEHIIDYARDGDDIENVFKQGGAQPGQVVLATNKGGRGTDIIIKEEQVPKGLHVILSFLPENTRIEEQAFGRAARAGQAGSGCLVVPIDYREYQDEIETFGSLETATEVIVEMEKIKRDQAETDRLGVLLSEGLPKLDLEEKMYLLFQEYRKAFASAVNVSSAKLFNIAIMKLEECKRACITIVTDRWAYWLDSMRTQIQAADTQDKRQQVQDLFNKEFRYEELSVPSTASDSPFFTIPEDYIQLGQAFLKEIQKPEKRSFKNNKKEMYSAAQTCFERAILKGDITGLPAMAACYCFVKLNHKATVENKKRVRHFLKIARSHLNELRRSWMSNGEIGRLLSDLLDVSQHVDCSENRYLQQTEEKIKVIGLHLNIIETLLGGTVDESSFVKESTLTSENITEKQSGEIYGKLVAHEFIYHHKVRKCWKKGDKLKHLLNKEVDPHIADHLMSLVPTSTSIIESDISKFIFSSEDLWSVLSPLMGQTEEVVVIEVKQVEAKLTSDEHNENWKKFVNQFKSQETDCQIVLPSHDPTLQKQEYINLISHLKDNCLVVETRRGLLIETACECILTLELGVYKDIEISRDGGHLKLRAFLAEVLKHCCENECRYLYEHMLPYGKKSLEAKKIHVFLQEYGILKSGQLAVTTKYGIKDEELRSLAEKALGKEYTEAQTSFILNVLQGLQGEVCKFERDMKVSFVDFSELDPRPDEIPQALEFFTTWHMDNFLTVEQADKGWCWDWNAFACAMIGLAQVIAGAALVVFTAGVGASIGAGLIAEGINDMMYATMAGLTGTFSWKDWAIQKAISIAITVATAGIGFLASGGSTAAKLGSPSTLAAFGKVMAKAAGQFAVSAVTGIISDIVLAEAQQQIVAGVVEFIQKNILSKMRDELHKRVTRLYDVADTDDAFHEKCQDIQKHLVKALQQLLPDHVDRIVSEISTCLSNSFDTLADNLSRSNSKLAKVAGNAAKAVRIAKIIYSAVKKVVKVGHLVSAVVKVLDCKSNKTQDTAEHSGQRRHSNSERQKGSRSGSGRPNHLVGRNNTPTVLQDCPEPLNTTSWKNVPTVLQDCPEPLNTTDRKNVPTVLQDCPEPLNTTDRNVLPARESLIESELADIERAYIEPIEKKLQSTLNKGVEKVVKKGVKTVGKASKKAVSKCVKKTFGKSPSQVVKNLSQNNIRPELADVTVPATLSQQQPLPAEEDEILKDHQKQRDTFKESICDPSNHQTVMMQAPAQPVTSSHGSIGSNENGQQAAPHQSHRTGGNPGNSADQRVRLLGGNPGGENPGNSAGQGVKKRSRKKAHDMLPETYDEYQEDNILYRQYKQRNGIQVKNETVYNEAGRVVLFRGTITGMEFTNERARTGPIYGMRSEKKLETFHVAPANAGVNAGGRFFSPKCCDPCYYGNAIPSTSEYNKKEWQERNRKGICKGGIQGKFDVTFKATLSNRSGIDRITSYMATYYQVRDGKRKILENIRMNEDVGSTGIKKAKQIPPSGSRPHTRAHPSSAWYITHSNT